MEKRKSDEIEKQRNWKMEKLYIGETEKQRNGKTKKRKSGELLIVIIEMECSFCLDLN